MSAPPRAPTFPSFVEPVQEVDDSAFIDASDQPSVPVVPLPVSQRTSVLRSVLLWHNPKLSGLCLGTALIFFYYTIVRHFSVLSVFALLFTVYQVLGAVIVRANKYTGRSLDKYVLRPPDGTPLFRHESATRYANILVDELNDVQCTLRDILYCDKPFVTFVCTLAGLFLYFIGHYVSILSLLLVLTLLLFSVPLAYQHNKTQVDQAFTSAYDTTVKHVNTGHKMAGEKTAQLLQNAPPAAREFAARVGLTPVKKKS